MITDDDRLMVTAYLEYRRAAGDGPNTTRKISSALGLAGRFVPGPLCEAGASDLRRFIGREMTADGARRMSDGTRRSYVGIVKGFYAFLVEDGYRDDDPSTRLPKVKVMRGQPRPFVQDEVDRLMDGAYFRTRVMIAIGFYQGYRVSQIAAVRGEDIDLVGRMIRTTGKGGKEAWHPLHPIVAAAALKMPREGYWFPARKGAEGHINGASVSDLVRRARVRAGIVNPKLTAHSLRHGFGTALVENGVDIRVVSELMMHADLSTTQIYTRVSPAMKRAGIDALPGTAIPTISNRARSAVHA